MTRAEPGSSTYDYIIVGAGSSGCVLAHRLSQDPDVSVLLLEAGGRGRHMMMRIPAGFSRLRKTEVDWGFQTVPQRHLNDRRLTFPLGKTLGGSSAINGMIYIRGQKEDYDSWAAAGNRGWSYDEVLPYFRRAENNEMLAGPYHGTEGPLSISNQRSPNILARAYIVAAQQAGHPFNADFNGETQLGANLYQVTQKDGRRASAATSYLLPAMARTNLTVVPNAFTHRLTVEGRRVVGVEYSVAGGVQTARCGREVLLSAGAVGSPKLLMLSGIGPADDLAALGIRPLHDLPVGRNYQDHLNCYVVCDLKEAISYDGQDQFPNNIRHGLQYLLFRNGAPTSPVAEAGCFVSSDGSGRPDIQTHALPAYVIHGGRTRLGGHGLTVNSCVLRPRSRGTVKLASTNPSDPPLIDPNYHDDDYDRRMAVEGIRQIREILRQPAIARHIKAERLPGSGQDSDAEILKHIRDYATVDYHPSGTCRMGTDDDAVVDPQLRLNGLDGLRVIDNSIMPFLNSGNTNATAIMIAEKAAAMIRGELPATA